MVKPRKLKTLVRYVSIWKKIQARGFSMSDIPKWSFTDFRKRTSLTSESQFRLAKSIGRNKDLQKEINVYLKSKKAVVKPISVKQYIPKVVRKKRVIKKVVVKRAFTIQKAKAVSGFKAKLFILNTFEPKHPVVNFPYIADVHRGFNSLLNSNSMSKYSNSKKYCYTAILEATFETIDIKTGNKAIGSADFGRVLHLTPVDLQNYIDLIISEYESFMGLISTSKEYQIIRIKMYVNFYEYLS